LSGGVVVLEGNKYFKVMITGERMDENGDGGRGRNQAEKRVWIEE